MNHLELDYELNSCQEGWLLRLLVDGEEVGKRVFSDHDNGLSIATVWLSSDNDPRDPDWLLSPLSDGV